MVLIACAALDFAHLPNCSRLIDALVQRVSSDIGMLKSPQSLVNVAWSLACLDKIDMPLLDQVRIKSLADVPLLLI